MRKKILLFFPNTSNRARIATAIPILSGIAKKHGWEINYFDTSFYKKEGDSVIDREKTGGFQPGAKDTFLELLPQIRLIPDLQSLIDNYKPDVIAITAMTCDYQYMMTFLPQIKIPDKTKVIIGGIHASVKRDEILSSNMFDLVCFGQGEGIFNEILLKIEQGKDLSDIAGTSYKNKKTGEVIHNQKRMLLSAEEIWATEEDYSFFDEKYFCYPFDGKTVNMFWVDLGRGCPYNCNYCGNTVLKEHYKGLGKYLVSRPIDSTFKLLKRMVEDFEVDVFNVTHECFLAQPISWLKEFSERWAKEIKKTILIVTRAETITEEKLEILKKTEAPIIQVGLGVESGSERILKEVCNRMVTTERVLEAYKLLHKNNFRTSAYYMLGFPYESRKDIFETIEVCRKVDADISSVSIFQPMPGQPLTETCIKEGYITGYEKIPSFTETSILKMPQISIEEISNLRRTFLLYASLPKEYWFHIEMCEKDYDNNKDLFDALVKLKWALANKKPKHQFQDPNFCNKLITK